MCAFFFRYVRLLYKLSHISIEDLTQKLDSNPLALVMASLIKQRVDRETDLG